MLRSRRRVYEKEKGKQVKAETRVPYLPVKIVFIVLTAEDLAKRANVSHIYLLQATSFSLFSLSSKRRKQSTSLDASSCLTEPTRLSVRLTVRLSIA